MRALFGLGLAGVLVVAANERLNSWRGGARTGPVLRGVLNLQELPELTGTVEIKGDGSGITPGGEADPNANPDPDPNAGADGEEEEVDNLAQNAIMDSPVVPYVLVGVAGLLLLAVVCDILSKVRLAVKVLRYLGTGKPDNALEIHELEAAHKQITTRFHCPKGGDAMKTAKAQQAEENRRAQELAAEAKSDAAAASEAAN